MREGREGRAGMGRPVLFVEREAGGWAEFVCEVLGVASRDAVDAGAIGESPSGIEFEGGVGKPAAQDGRDDGP